jgi:hypothetical protein
MVTSTDMYLKMSMPEEKSFAVLQRINFKQEFT